MMHCTETLLWGCVGVCGTARAVFVLSGSAKVPLGGNVEEAPPLSADFTPLLFYGVYCSTSSQTAQKHHAALHRFSTRRITADKPENKPKESAI